MGQVWEARHLRLSGRRVAIKVLHSRVEDPELLARFEREAHILAQLQHPHIVQVLDFAELPSGAPYQVLELLEGENLDERLARGPLAHDEAVEVVREVGSALQAAHSSGVIHRDLKPGNIFLAKMPDGTTRAKVLDFGISKLANATTVLTRESTVVGTPQYMAPEQASPRVGPVDHRTDIFALGATLYEMLTGRPAFEGEDVMGVLYQIVHEEPLPLRSLAPTVPPLTEATVERALKKKSSERFDTVQDMVETLTGDKPFVRAGPSTLNLALWASVVAVVLLGAGVAIFELTRGSEAGPAPTQPETPATVAAAAAQPDAEPAPREQYEALPEPEPGPVAEPSAAPEPAPAQPDAAVSANAEVSAAPEATPGPPARTPRTGPRAAGDPPEPAQPKGRVLELMTEALDRYEAGDLEGAKLVAKRALRHGGGPHARFLLARIACRFKDQEGVKVQARHLPRHLKRRLRRVCTGLGIEF